MNSDAFKGQGRRLGSSSESRETTMNSNSHADLRTSIEGQNPGPTRSLSRLTTQSVPTASVEDQDDQDASLEPPSAIGDRLSQSETPATKKRKRRASTASTASLPSSARMPSAIEGTRLPMKKTLKGEEIIELLTDEDRQHWMEWLEQKNEEADPLESLEIWYHNVRPQTLVASSSISTTRAEPQNPLYQPNRPKIHNDLIDTTSTPPRKMDPIPGGFRHPVVLKTWCFGYPRDRDIKLEEVLQKRHLSGVVISSFGWDLDFWWSKIDRDTTPCQFVMQQEHLQPGTRLQDNAHRIIVHPETTNIQHAKIMVLFYEEKKELRVVITSANMMAYDWGEMGGFMENTVFVIDLPKAENKDLTRFGVDFSQYCRSLGLSARLVNQFREYDWELTRDLIFVCAQGQASAQELPFTGLAGLSQKLAQAGLTYDGELEIDYVASSIGKLNWEFLSYLYQACKGKGSLPSPARCKSQCTPDELTNNIRVYFASQHTVDGSKGGRQNASPLCLYPSNYHSLGEEKKVFHDCVSHRPGCMMHSKILFVQPKGFNSSDPTTDQHAQARRWHENPHSRSTITQSAAEGNNAGSDADREKLTITRQSIPTAWVYVGSANCSWAGWGHPKNLKKKDTGYTTGSNWECGVIIPIRKPQAGQNRLDTFSAVVPVPMRDDTESLHPRNRKPFFGSEQQAGDFQQPGGLI